ncbi:MAG: M48 family metalloprotease [Burkholderiaceae bacterium]|nr:M48 family metalloprotease [Burkholderiaceae bacterium]
MNLVYKNEKTLFGILLAISLIIWAGFIIGTFGGALIYLLFGYIFYLFAQSALISYLKGTAVQITATQFPDLHERVVACCQKLGLHETPDAYILHVDGAFNAFATRFLGRNFIVLFSDIVDALEENPDALNFYIGHEIGHIKRNHLRWAPVLFPGSVVPLIGAAYSRAREYTADRHGFAACADVNSAQFGLAALAAGGKRWRTMSKTAYVQQIRDTRGFWMSFHEYLSDYPWLVKRMAVIKGLAAGVEMDPPRRNPFAGFLALFVPRLAVAGGSGSLLMTVAIIGILAAVAIPAYQDYTAKAKLLGVVYIGKQATEAVASYYYAKGAVPDDIAEAGVSPSAFGANIQDISVGKNGAVKVDVSVVPYVGKSIFFFPSLTADKKIVWHCESRDIPNKVLPLECQAK